MMRLKLLLPLICLVGAATGLIAERASAAPAMVDPADGTLILLTTEASQQADLARVDGLALDAFGNLMAA